MSHFLHVGNWVGTRSTKEANCFTTVTWRAERKYVHISCWLVPLWGRWWTPGNLRRNKWRHLWALCPNQKRNTHVCLFDISTTTSSVCNNGGFFSLKMAAIFQSCIYSLNGFAIATSTMNDFTLRSRFLRKRIRQWAGIPVVSWILFENFSSWGDF